MNVTVDYLIADFKQKASSTSKKVTVTKGQDVLHLAPPEDAIVMTLSAEADNGAYTSLVLRAGYSPSGTFIRLTQTTPGMLRVGQRATFHVDATKEFQTLFYEILARGQIVYSGVTNSSDIDVVLTPRHSSQSPDRGLHDHTDLRSGRRLPAVHGEGPVPS